MTVKEAKTINSIHALLMAPLAGLDNNGHIIDHAEYDASVQGLSKRLSNRNTKPLKLLLWMLVSCQEILQEFIRMSGWTV